MNQQIIGVDFSGAALAGEKIWVAVAQNRTDGLEITALQRGTLLPDSAPERETALRSLVAFLAQHENAIVGFDFPFSLTQSALDNTSWLDWLEDVAQNFNDADAFRAAFPDEKRQCDVKAKTPFSPLNLRLYRQTFHGLNDVLWPLIQQHEAVVVPMMPLREGGLTLIEICPASLLKKEKLYLSYKGKNAAQRVNREIILNEMESRFGLHIAPELAEIALENDEGDALDAILATLCVHCALKRGEINAAKDETEAVEGRVYF